MGEVFTYQLQRLVAFDRTFFKYKSMIHSYYQSPFVGMVWLLK